MPQLRGRAGWHTGSAWKQSVTSGCMKSAAHTTFRTTSHISDHVCLNCWQLTHPAVCPKNVIYVCISSLKCIFSNINLQRYLSCIETYRKGFLLYILCYIKSAGQKAWNIWRKRSKRECVFKLIHRKMCEYTKSEFWHPSAAPTQKTDLDVRWKGVCTWAALTPEGPSHHSVESWGFVWAFLSAAQGLSDITNSI